jgi:NADPH:quinone reductase-like Zn-dependent oxidoreductase
MTSTMKAVRLFEFGGADVLRYADYPQPEVGPHDVKVRVLASTISQFDVKYRKGLIAKTKLPGRKAFPMPMQLGRDTAGVVEEVGKEVENFKSGDRVVGLTSPANPMSPLTIMGLGNLSSDIDLPGHTMFGSNAQFVARPASYWLPLPEKVGMVEAAAAMWAYGTSHRVLLERLRSRFGDTILIVGASGGMGSATLDLARGMGLRTIVTARSHDDVAFLRERGASEVVILDDHAAENLRKLSGGLGLDSAVDFSGAFEMIRLCIDVLRPGGSLAVMAGEQHEGPMPITVIDCVGLELNLCGGRGSNLSDQQAVVRLLAQGEIKPAIAAVMKLSEAVRAHEILEAGGVKGRIVLEPWS